MVTITAGTARLIASTPIWKRCKARYAPTRKDVAEWTAAIAQQPISNPKDVEMTANDNNAQDFTCARTFDAPRELVWEVYTKLEHLSKWWGPAGFTWLSGTLDFRPGGIFHYGM